MVEVAYQYSDDTSKRIRGLRKEQWNIIITAVLFGLTLNLIADFVNSFGDPAIALVTILYRCVVAMIAVLVTIGVMTCLVIREFHEECEKEREIELDFFFNQETGEPYSETHYPPTDRLAIVFARSNQEEKEELTELVKEAAAKRDTSKLLPFHELLTIYELTHRRVPFEGESETISFMDKIELKQSPIGSKDSVYHAYSFKIPGWFDSEYGKFDTTGTLPKKTLIINWKKGYHGKMTIEFEYTQGFIYHQDKDLLLRPISGHLSLYRLVTNIVMKTKFSPMRLFFRKSNVEMLIEWSNNLYNRLLDTADWKHHIQSYENEERKSAYSITLFG
ncbi:MAG: hypothetical protein JW779_05040 [Candidatus Thorarchaeota archaeon]|nr:hypothetical protein [Candidatus Thorarchaeota archaeon]